MPDTLLPHHSLPRERGRIREGGRMKTDPAKTAYSPLLKVAGDYSCGIFDGAGDMVAQGPDLPIHLGSMPDAVRAVIATHPEVEPGDVFIHNDPYHGGSHLPDVNVLAPAERQGDLRAQVAANRRAALRLETLARKYGADQLLKVMNEVLDYSETMMRAALRLLPDGEASFTDVFDGDGVLAPGAEADEPFTVRLKVRKQGETITADFAGSDNQVPGPMNAPLTVTASGVFCALKMIADPKSLIPPNSGCWRPVTVTAPPGSVVNAQPPAPVVYANHEISHRVADMVMAAM